jgi:hypothetical protein
MPATIPKKPVSSAIAARPKPLARGIGERGQGQHGERDEAADEVIAGRGARIRLEERVVDHVQRDQRERCQEERVRPHGRSTSLI